jgi:hypothetical protein
MWMGVVFAAYFYYKGGVKGWVGDDTGSASGFPVIPHHPETSTPSPQSMGALEISQQSQ